MTPRPDVLAFGSATASTISEPGWTAAAALWLRLQAEILEEGVEATWQAQECRIREAVGGQLKLPNAVHVQLTPSGTDALEAGARRLASEGQQRLAVIAVASSETGSGVHAALVRGCGEGRTRLAAVAVRDPFGHALEGSHVDDAFDDAVRSAIAADETVILVLTDLTKTGLLVPNPATARELQARWGARIRVLVDLCQMRASDTVVRAYLDRAWPVAITGSKFWTGPSFSGALLTPGLAPWPTLSSPPNFGLLLRWEAALADAAACFAHGPTEIARFLGRFADVVERELDQSGFVLATVSGPDRGDLSPMRSWDAAQTIFPFREGLRTSPSFTRVGAARLHRRLALVEASAKPLELGQPVRLDSGGVEAYALRFCASARLVAEALNSADHEEGVLERLRAAVRQATEEHAMLRARTE